MSLFSGSYRALLVSVVAFSMAKASFATPNPANTVKAKYRALGATFDNPKGACDDWIRQDPGRTPASRPTKDWGDGTYTCFWTEEDGRENEMEKVRAVCPASSRLAGDKCVCVEGHVVDGEACVSVPTDDETTVPTAAEGGGSGTARPNDETEHDANGTRMRAYRVECFKTEALGKNPEKLKEMGAQLRRQQEALNELTVGEFEFGQFQYFSADAPRRGENAKQNAVREAYIKKIAASMAKSMLRGKVTLKEFVARLVRNSAKLAKIKSTLAALHEPDTRVYPGGSVTRLGDAQVNSAIGGQWVSHGFYDEYSRANQLLKAVQEASNELGPDVKLNVVLETCHD